MALKVRSQGETPSPSSLASLQSLIPLHCSVLQGKMRLCNYYVCLILSVQLLYIVASLHSCIEHSAHLRTFNLWMNGPRVHWARGLQLVFQLFIIFNKGEIFQLEENPQDTNNGWYYFSSIWAFITASHMAVLQLHVLRLDNANMGYAQEFVGLNVFERFHQYGMGRLFL